MEDLLLSRLPMAFTILLCVTSLTLWNAVTDAHGPGQRPTRPAYVPHNCTWEADDVHRVTRVQCINVGLTSVPDDLPGSQELRLEYNDLEILETVPYPNLRWAYFESNSIYKVADGAFQNLTQLTTLNLANNSITRVSAGHFQGLDLLHLLVLQGNPIYEVGAGSLGGLVLPKLETLDMAGCKIYEFSPQAFDLDSPLRILNISNNRLTSFAFLSQLKALRVLDLSFNRLKSLAASPFRGLSMIDDLHLSHNDVTHIYGEDLQGLTRLKKLSLSHNRLSVIAHSAFRHTPGIEYLDLSYNAFVLLERDRLPWGSLSTILVHNNPWDCGCKTAWLRSSKVLLDNLESNLTCFSPTAVEGAAVYTINMSFFHCLNVARRDSERALAIGLGVVIGLIIAMIATLLVYRLVFKARRRSRDGTLTVSASSPYSRVDSRELVLKNDDI